MNELLHTWLKQRQQENPPTLIADAHVISYAHNPDFIYFKAELGPEN